MFFLPHQPLPTFPLLRRRRPPISHPHLLLSSGYHIHVSSSDLPSLSTPLTTPLLTNLVDPAFNPSSSFQMRPWQQEEEDGGESRPVIGQVQRCSQGFHRKEHEGFGVGPTDRLKGDLGRFHIKEY
ncbi:hypothetical protein C1H46_026439 [Malus baccata]|uniref:Uncharacterized protein n=1 Tax=Malus baccata TaxID=106549 RepID=A0A540LNE8_MALBA|nr:hypothetical protein C1H46_026439 [Malus baccata]